MEREGAAIPILLGHPEVIQSRIAELGLRIQPTVIEVEESPRLQTYAEAIYRERRRKGVTRHRAEEMAHMPNIFGIMMVKLGDADGVVAGLDYDYPAIIRPALQLIRTRPGVTTAAGVFMVIAREQPYFFADGLVNIDPGPEELADIAILTADFARELEIEPHIAMLSFSNFGSVRHPAAEKMRKAVHILHERRPDLNVDGEMQPDVALSDEIADERYPFSQVRKANVLIFPNLDAANASYKLLSRLGDADLIGPVLVGLNRSVHALQPGADVRDILRMMTMAAVGAQECSSYEL
jgi:malate dehydrogenase (oxaloacetate-decarboxylating)(NADP+)